jgi:hypothetical protein
MNLHPLLITTAVLTLAEFALLFALMAHYVGTR